MAYAPKTGPIARAIGALFGILAAMTHAFAYGLYMTHVWNGEIDGNIVSWALFSTEFIVLLIYRDLSKDIYKDMLYIICATCSVLVFALVCVKLYQNHIPIEAKLTPAYVGIAIVDVIVLILWARLRNKGAEKFLNAFLQIDIVLSFLPIAHSTWLHPENEWALPWVIWTGAYVLQLLSVKLREDENSESSTTTLQYIGWHAAMTMLIFLAI